VSVRRWHSKPAFIAAIARGLKPLEAARSAGITRKTAYAWKKSDPEFAAAWLDAREQMIEEAESQLYKHVCSGNLPAVMYALRHWAADRYGTKVKLAGDAENPVTINAGRPIIQKPTMVFRMPDNHRDNRPGIRQPPPVSLPFPMPESLLEIYDAETGEITSLTADGRQVAAEDIETVVAAVNEFNDSLDGDRDPMLAGAEGEVVVEDEAGDDVA
jgi:hypothetical protein